MALANGCSQRLDQLSPAELFGMMNSASSSASQEALLVTDFAETSAGGLSHSTSSLLSFALGDQEECDVWIDAMDHSYYLMNQFELRPSRCGSNLPIEEQICAAEIVSSYSCVGTSPVKKRPSSDNNLPSPKKRCGASRTTIKGKQSPSKDPQSIAAKNRRERISERLKTLQELVPNGTKVDLVTMLERAINYVKFLQLQVKVLATDEFWPAQGGKAPDVAQVREAIDAILSSQGES